MEEVFLVVRMGKLFEEGCPVRGAQNLFRKAPQARHTDAEHRGRVRCCDNARIERAVLALGIPEFEEPLLDPVHEILPSHNKHSLKKEGRLQDVGLSNQTD